VYVGIRNWAGNLIIMCGSHNSIKILIEKVKQYHYSKEQSHTLYSNQLKVYLVYHDNGAILAKDIGCNIGKMGIYQKHYNI